MGMFDTIAWDAPCPMCNQPVEWQTKQGPQSLTTMTADVFAADVIDNGDGSEDWVHWHTWCSACRLWTEVRTRIRSAPAARMNCLPVTAIDSSGQPETYHAAKVRKAAAIRAEEGGVGVSIGTKAVVIENALRSVLGDEGAKK